jgi:hypothetical protein
MCCILVHLRAAHRTLNPVPGPRRNKSPSFYHLIKIIWYKILVVHLEVPWPYQKETLHERLELRVQIAYTEARTKSANSTHRCINHMGMRACYHPSSRVHPHWGCVYGTILPAGPCATLFWFTHRWLQSTQTNKVPWPYQMEIELGSLLRVHTKLFGSPTKTMMFLDFLDFVLGSSVPWRQILCIGVFCPFEDKFFGLGSSVPLKTNSLYWGLRSLREVVSLKISLDSQERATVYSQERNNCPFEDKFFGLGVFGPPWRLWRTKPTNTNTPYRSC